MRRRIDRNPLQFERIMRIALRCDRRLPLFDVRSSVRGHMRPHSEPRTLESGRFGATLVVTVGDLVQDIVHECNRPTEWACGPCAGC